MRSLLDTEEEEETKPSEITLSTASLLGIFFGLVLVCGVFFGFGYSTGRGTGHAAQAAVPASAPEPEPTGTAQNTPPPQPPQEEPQVVVKTPTKAPDPVAETSDVQNPPAPPTPKPSAKKPSAVEQAALESQATITSTTDANAGKPMVQIAAVARREDADVLVSALRQRGYGVVIRSEPQDKLLHVQVGPFADRVQATAIKQKLLSDGYNAIIKQ
jgi:DedD protein